MPTGSTARGQRTKQRILAAATLELVERDGVVEFAAVAKRAGVSSGAPYRHFASKSDLLVALMDDFYDTWEGLAYRPTFEAFSDDWWVREKERIRLTVAFHYEHPLGALIHQRLVGDAEAARRQRDRAHRQVRGAIKNVTRGQTLGRVPAHIDAEMSGAVLMGGVYQALHTASARKRPMAQARVTRELHNFMRRVLCIEEE